MCPDLTVAENIMLGRLPRAARSSAGARRGGRQPPPCARRGFAIPATAGGPRRRAGRPPPDRRRSRRGARLPGPRLRRDDGVVDDRLREPSCSTSSGARRADGAAIIFISHRLDEVMHICDSVTVLRDGEVSGTVPVAGTSEPEIIRLMVGRTLEARHGAATEPGRRRGARVARRAPARRRPRASISRCGRARSSASAGSSAAAAPSCCRPTFGLLPRHGEVLVGGHRLKAREPARRHLRRHRLRARGPPQRRAGDGAERPVERDDGPHRDVGDVEGPVARSPTTR